MKGQGSQFYDYRRERELRGVLLKLYRRKFILSFILFTVPLVIGFSVNAYSSYLYEKKQYELLLEKNRLTNYRAEVTIQGEPNQPRKELLVNEQFYLLNSNSSPVNGYLMAVPVRTPDPFTGVEVDLGYQARSLRINGEEGQFTLKSDGRFSVGVIEMVLPEGHLPSGRSEFLAEYMVNNYPMQDAASGVERVRFRFPNELRQLKVDEVTALILLPSYVDRAQLEVKARRVKYKAGAAPLKEVLRVQEVQAPLVSKILLKDKWHYQVHAEARGLDSHETLEVDLKW